MTMQCMVAGNCEEAYICMAPDECLIGRDSMFDKAASSIVFDCCLLTPPRA